LAGTFIKLKKGAKPKKPILVVGLPGIGNVGRLVADQLIKELKAEKFATLYSDHFPHQVIMLKNGGIRMVSNRFYLAKGKTNDIVILTGDVQAITPEGQFEVNRRIVSFFKKTLKGNVIYTLGGYSKEGASITIPRVLGNATNKKVVDALKAKGVIFGESAGMIWGSAGQIIAFAKMEKMDAACLMGESVFLDFDAHAAKSVTKKIAEILGLQINTKNIDQMIEKGAKAIKDMEGQPGTPMLGAHPTGPEKQPSYIR
jgi:uncharacterized protein